MTTNIQFCTLTKLEGASKEAWRQVWRIWTPRGSLFGCNHTSGMEEETQSG